MYLHHYRVRVHIAVLQVLYSVLMVTDIDLSLVDKCREGNVKFSVRNPALIQGITSSSQEVSLYWNQKTHWRWGKQNSPQHRKEGGRHSPVSVVSRNCGSVFHLDPNPLLSHWYNGQAGPNWWPGSAPDPPTLWPVREYSFPQDDNPILDFTTTLSGHFGFSQKVISIVMLFFPYHVLEVSVKQIKY